MTEAVQRYAAALERDEAAIIAAAEDGMGDMAAGRFELISGPRTWTACRLN